MGQSGLGLRFQSLDERAENPHLQCPRLRAFRNAPSLKLVTVREFKSRQELATEPLGQRRKIFGCRCLQSAGRPTT